MENKEMLKRVLIAGAAQALRYMNENPRADDHEVLQSISNNSDEIIQKID